MPDPQMVHFDGRMLERGGPFNVLFRAQGRGPNCSRLMFMSSAVRRGPEGCCMRC